MAREPVAITEDFLLDHVGVYDIVGTKELLLRNEGIERLDEACAKKLVSLELLSLSHNALESLNHFQHLTNLVELNVNFNQIASLDTLQCFGLQKLYVANNKLTSIAHLRSFPQLVHVSVFGNQLTDFDGVMHTCRHLHKLRGLDLDGNPCARVKGYKYLVLSRLTRLKELDGDTIHALDRELLLEQQPLPPSCRPSTAPPAPPTTSSLTRMSSRSSLLDTVAEKEASLASLRGPVHLFRDDFLNNNSILLEYLAQGVDGHRPTQDSPASATDAALATPSSTFVGKMRQANPNPALEAVPLPSDAEDGGGRSAPCPMATPAPLATHSIVDPSDPHATIRKLLKHIEHLEASVDMYKSSASDATMERLLEANHRLRIENNNIPILQEEIQALKATLRHAPPDYNDSGETSAGTAKAASIKALQDENAALTRQVHKLRTMLATRQATDETMSAKQSKEEILDEAANVDVELTALIMQNEISLQVMRQTIQKTKLDLQQDRAARLTGHQRPSTSAGIERTGVADSGPRLSALSGAVRSPTTRRQLHTSAGHRPRPSSSSHHAPAEAIFNKTSKSKPSITKCPSVPEAPTSDVNDHDGTASNNNHAPDLLVL
ncbi:hypothetical protein H310_07762 [Aphanomyces invadans]|uniref:U2A'/phosphoprotein 32 family A C-terminal domain-containing protein n=1 Tax=Aphanomyces invadans TaxID=157072 RepID=A0A024U0A8_9STRA|nr:hypothetical protein H310_07762 [Aphanomyces invadans]ETV99698.1 hypothetical protein H310_07762 [Aphanomyces invadans]|eukprot:XP_008871474.1 hypothetical protein H310_07762 [Aphanomyces invadans]